MNFIYMVVNSIDKLCNWIYSTNLNIILIMSQIFKNFNISSSSSILRFQMLKEDSSNHSQHTIEEQSTEEEKNNVSSLLFDADTQNKAFVSFCEEFKIQEGDAEFLRTNLFFHISIIRYSRECKWESYTFWSAQSDIPQLRLKLIRISDFHKAWHSYHQGIEVRQEIQSLIEEKNKSKTK